MEFEGIDVMAQDGRYPATAWMPPALHKQRKTHGKGLKKTLDAVIMSVGESGDSMKLFQKIKLKSGEYAHIVEIYEDGVAYEADIYSKDGKTRTDTIRQSDIAATIMEIEQPLVS